MRKHKGILICTMCMLAGLLTDTSAAGPAGESDALAGTWQPIAGPLGGSVAAVVVSPTYPMDHTAFAAVRGYGVYRTEDAGRSWVRITPDEERSGWVIMDLVVSPNYAEDRTLFVLTSIWTYGGNVYRSTDGGDSWQAADSHPDGMLPGAFRLVISPNFAHDGLIYVLSGRQLLCSTDGGQNFADLDPPWFGTHRIQALAFSPTFAADRTLIASVWDEGLHRSTNAGATWTPIGSGLSPGVSPALALSPNFDADGTALLVSDQDQTIYRSTDGGDNWVATDLTLRPVDHWLAFSPDFATDGTAFAGGQNDDVVYRSTDGGQHWSAFGEGLPGAGSFGLAPSPAFRVDGTAFLAHSAGVYQVTISGSHGTWNPVHNGLPRLRVSALDAGPPGAEDLFAGTIFFEDVRSAQATPYNGNVHRSTDGVSWQPASPRLDQVIAVAVSPDYGADHTVFVATGYMAGHGVQGGHVYRTTDGGDSWREMPDLVFLQALALSPDYAHDQTVFAVSAYPYGGGVCRSTDRGESWTRVKLARSGILALSPAYAADGIVFTASFDHLLRSADRGDTWTPVFSGAVRALVLSSHFAMDRIAYLVSEGDLYRSSDAGLTWQMVTTDLPAPPSILAFGPDNALYASTESGGVYLSTDGGHHWETVGDFPAGRQITALKWRHGDRPDDWTLYAGTDAGLWAYRLPFVPATELVNGGFEEGFYLLEGQSIANGWAAYTAWGQPTFAGERFTVHSGLWAYKISGYAPFTAGLAQAVQVEPGKTYRVTAYYQLYPPGDGQALLGVQDGTSATQWVGGGWPGVWQPLSQEITVASERLTIMLQGHNGVGLNTNVYFDDVTVVAVGSP